LNFGQWAMSTTYTRTCTSRSTPLPQASRTACTLCSTWRAWSSNGALASFSPAAVIGSWPATKTKPLAIVAWL
jgi:hypothetical protein